MTLKTFSPLIFFSPIVLCRNEMQQKYFHRVDTRDLTSGSRFRIYAANHFRKLINKLLKRQKNSRVFQILENQAEMIFLNVMIFMVKLYPSPVIPAPGFKWNGIWSEN